MIRILLFPFLFLISLTVFSQEFIEGRIMDEKTHEPVPFATVRLKGKALGVISNMDGGFKVPARFRSLGDTLQISSMGYRSKELKMSSLSPRDVNMITLAPGILQLSEAVVKARKRKPLSARQIVRRAIRAIPDNFPVTPFSMVGYYRDYQLWNSKYINLNEAIFEVFDQGFNALNYETTRVRIYDYRANADFERDTLSLKPYDYVLFGKVIDHAFLSGYGGNEFTILQIHDAIRNHAVGSFNFVNRFDSDLLANHIFAKDPDTFSDDERLFTIRFQKVYPGYGAYGTLYISKADFAIHKLEYALYDERKRLPSSTLNQRGERYRLIFQVQSSYKKEAGKMFLNYISFHNSFLVRVPPVFRVNDLTVDMDRKCFTITFNHPPVNDDAADLSNYKIYFNGKRIRLLRVERLQEEVRLYPEWVADESEAMFEAIRAGNKAGQNALREMIAFEVKDIQDAAGNLINEWTSREYDQFREFFVQEIKPHMALPRDTLLMDKNHPIFGHQPIVKPPNFGDYWMNTPLESSRN